MDGIERGARRGGHIAQHFYVEIGPVVGHVEDVGHDQPGGEGAMQRQRSLLLAYGGEECSRVEERQHGLKRFLLGGQRGRH